MDATAPRGTAWGRVLGWAAPGVPAGRVAVLRTLVHLFVIWDVLAFSNGALAHGDTPRALYRPLTVRTLLHMAAPGHADVHALLGLILATTFVAALPLTGWVGWVPRASGLLCAAAMLDWLSNNFSYGKVDHDHVALLVALVVLQTVPAARWSDRTPDEAAGWALRCIQVAVVATYFLSAVAKVRFGGWGWPASAIFTWAFVRRGSWLADQLLRVHPAVVGSQWALIVVETLTPALLWLRRWPLYAYVALLGLFHLTTYLLLGIHFLPLVICLPAFLPLERLVPSRWSSAGTH